MSGFVQSGVIRGWGFAFMAGLAAIAVCPDSAYAACGDYVMVRGRHLPSNHAAMAGDPTSAALNSTALHSTEYSSPARRIPRCSGPQCSDGSIPPAAPAPKLQSTLERWACSLSTALADPLQSSSLFAEPDVIVAQGPGLSILRPPR